MKNVLEEKVINQNVGGMSMENYLSDLLAKLDKEEIDKVSCESKIAVLKQLNNRHKNVIDAQRVMLKQAEFETMKLNG